MTTESPFCTKYDEQIHCKVQMKRKCKADRLDDLLDNLAEESVAPLVYLDRIDPNKISAFLQGDL